VYTPPICGVQGASARKARVYTAHLRGAGRSACIAYKAITMQPSLEKVILRPPAPADEGELLALNRASADHYHPWVQPPIDSEQFASYLERAGREDVCARLICHVEGQIMGAVTLSQIFYGALCSAYMGYYIGVDYAGQGYASAGIAHMLDYAFGPLKLHRVEANIQPGNGASLALVRRLGFTREGYSRRYLHINGDWRDHERWAILADERAF
jgi:[ribosomal protein S5]-alanine N-acetyltransferase